MSKRVIIIGAGIAGIATANLLAKAGYEVHIYEKSGTAGGRAGLIEVDGFRFDTGPSWYLMPGVFEHYYNLLGIDIHTELDLKRLSPAYKVFFENNNPITITSDINKDKETFESVEKGAGDTLDKYVHQSKQVYDLSVKYFLYSNFNRLTNLLHKDILKNSFTMLHHAIRPIDKYVSSYFRDQRLKQIMEYPMVFLGTSPYHAPSLYSLMSALDFEEGVFYPNGGMYTIIESLTSIANKLGVVFHYNREVTKILSQNGKAQGIEFSNGETRLADIIISNADLHHTETNLLAPSQQSYPNRYWSKKQASPSALLIYLGIKGTLPDFSHHNLLFVDDWKKNFEDIYSKKKLPNPASIYICKPSHTDKTVAPEGHENVFVLVPLPAGISIMDSERESLASKYIEQIESMTGESIQDKIVFQKNYGPNDFYKDYYSWQNSMLGPSHILRQSAFFRTPNVSKKLSNLFYTGAGTVPGIGLPMCLISAELIYKRLANDLSAQRSHTIKSLQADDL